VTGQRIHGRLKERARAAADGRTRDEVRDLYVAELRTRGLDVPPTQHGEWLGRSVHALLGELSKAGSWRIGAGGPVQGLTNWPGLEDRDDRRYFGMVIRPNCFLSLLPDHVIVHRFEPVSPELTKVVCEWLFPPETVAAHDIGDAVELFHLVNQQDFAASEWCQPNMRSRAYASGGVLATPTQPAGCANAPGCSPSRCRWAAWNR